MALFEGKTPAERNKLIAAIGLGVISLFFLARMFLFSSSSGSSTSPRNANNTDRRRSSAPPTISGNNVQAPPSEEEPDPFMVLRPIEYSWPQPDVPQARRNIFAYYVPPPSPQKVPLIVNGVPTPPPPTPTPTPPLMLASVSPPNVYARTSDFTLEVSGDKFTPAAHIFMDGRELPTRFTNAQRVSATVPAALIASPGARQVVVRTPDGQLYSNAATLNVTPPPTPPFTYVGFLGRQHYNNETAVLKNQSGELVSVQRGDPIGGRFRVTSVSERAVELTDTQLNIKHTLPFVENRSSASGPNFNPPQRPFPQPPPKADDDDEP